MDLNQIRSTRDQLPSVDWCKIIQKGIGFFLNEDRLSKIGWDTKIAVFQSFTNNTHTAFIIGRNKQVGPDRVSLSLFFFAHSLFSSFPFIASLSFPLPLNHQLGVFCVVHHHPLPPVSTEPSHQTSKCHNGTKTCSFLLFLY